MPRSEQKDAKAPGKSQGQASYARGDTRNLLRVALALSKLEHPTLNNLARETGHVKSGILRDIERLQAYLGIVIEKRGPEYLLHSWGPVVKSAEGIEQFLSASLGEGKS
jgi:hypothetical protein